MAVHIRLSRAGTKKRPFYNIVAADSRAPRDGRFIEKLGTYNPLLARDDSNRVTMNVERIKHWLGVGAKPSERVALFLGVAGIAPMPARPDRPQKAAPKKKAQERMEAQQKAAADSAAAAAQSPEPAAVESEPAAEESSEPVKETADEQPLEEQPEEPQPA